MKKIKFGLMAFIAFFIGNINVLAASASLNVSSDSVYVGDSFTVSVNMVSAASWNIHVTASGAVNGCSIVEVEASNDALNTNKTFSAVCTATSTGTIKLVLSGDLTDENANAAVNISGQKTVKVNKKPVTPSNNNNGNTNNNSNGNNNNSNNTNNNTNNNNNNKNNGSNTNVKSDNNKIKELTIEGYKLEKIDDNNYTLSVSNDAASVNVKAVLEDTKAKITGAGKHELKIGENNIELVVTSESGKENKIIIKITRKDSYYMEDLETVLKNDKLKDINIKADVDDKITKEDLTKIKKSDKKVTFNYYDDKKLLYSWIVDGKKITKIDDIELGISYESEYKKEMLKLANYAEGLYISFKQNGDILKGTKIKLYVGNMFKDGDMVNVYSYIIGSDKLNLVKDSLKVKNGYIEFDGDSTSNYLVTMAKILNNNEVITSYDKPLSKIIPILILIILVLAIMVLLIILIIKRRKNKDISSSTTVAPSYVLSNETTINDLNKQNPDIPIVNNNVNNINDNEEYLKKM